MRIPPINQIHLFCYLIFSASPFMVPATGAEPSPPNIVLVYMDDLGYGDVVVNGATGFQTPQIDRLAANGMRFTQFNVTHPVCSASRVSLLTGAYSNRVGISMALLPDSDQGLNPAEETLAELLQEVGYRTGLVGKWHLGDRPGAMPLRHGFEEFFGPPYSNDMWRKQMDGSPFDSANPPKPPRANWPDTIPIYEGDTVVREIHDMEEMGLLTKWLTERAVRFINNQDNRPFFLLLAHSMPHFPIAASPEFRDRSNQGRFGDVMEEIDWSIGEVLQALAEMGVEENTLVIFTSDNGPETIFGDHGGSAGGLRGSKVTTWEGGHRVPFVARWPGRIPAGTVCNQLAANIDLLPTLAEWAGFPLPSRKIDGCSITRLLEGNVREPVRTTMYYYFRDNNLDAVRYKDWKLVFPHTGRVVRIPGIGGMPGKARRLEAESALYDLRSDPGERLNVKDYYPSIVAKLEAMAEKARRELGDSLIGAEGSEVRPAGHYEP